MKSTLYWPYIGEYISAQLKFQPHLGIRPNLNFKPISAQLKFQVHFRIQQQPTKQ
jgi:hypothetical protein